MSEGLNQAEYSIEVQYFAILRELAGVARQTVTVNASMTCADLYRALAHQHHFPLGLQEIQVAVNDEFVDLNQTLSTGARIIFIPPVAGG